MTLRNWLVGGIDNPFKKGQWGPLHIATMIVSIGLVVLFYFLVKRANNKDKARKIIVSTLVLCILFFEVTSRILYAIKLYVLHQPEMAGTNLIWILLPKPWCAISCWALMIAPLVKKDFFYNYASLSALLCSVIFFAYPGVGFNNVYLLFFNWYSILTHALLLTTSLTLIVLKFTNFKYSNFWKFALCLVLTFIYGLIEIYVLKIQLDPMYFMPNGDIQAGILNISYGLYLFLYITLIVVYVNAFYLVGDRQNIKKLFAKLKNR
ncbi:MAG: YwaF family protein [Clostridia bacterium]|nr:YwaF family protein [Clostridia bacterium]